MLERFRFSLTAAREALRRLFQRPLDPPDDPYAYVRAPRKPKPSGRASSVALAEPDSSHD